MLNIFRAPRTHTLQVMALEREVADIEEARRNLHVEFDTFKAKAESELQDLKELKKLLQFRSNQSMFRGVMGPDASPDRFSITVGPHHIGSSKVEAKTEISHAEDKVKKAKKRR